MIKDFNYIKFVLYLKKYNKSKQRIVSSNIPPIQPKEDQTKDAVGNLKTDEQKSSDSDFAKPISEDKEKDMALNKLTSLDESRSS